VKLIYIYIQHCFQLFFGREAACSLACPFPSLPWTTVGMKGETKSINLDKMLTSFINNL